MSGRNPRRGQSRVRSPGRKLQGSKWEVDLRVLEARLLAMTREDANYVDLMDLYLAAHWRRARQIVSQGDQDGDNACELDEWVDFWTNPPAMDPNSRRENPLKFQMGPDMAAVSFDYLFNTPTKSRWGTKVLVSKKGKVPMKSVDGVTKKLQKYWEKLMGKLKTFQQSEAYQGIIKQESEILAQEFGADESKEAEPEETESAVDDPSELSPDEYNQDAQGIDTAEFERLRAELEAEREKSAQLDESVTEQSVAIEEYEAKLADLNSQLEAAKSANGDAAGAAAELVAAKNQCQQLEEEQKGKAERITQLTNELELAKNSSTQAESERDSLRDQLAGLEAEKNEYESKTKELQDQLSQLQAQQEGAAAKNEALLQCEQDRADLTAKIQELEQSLQERTQETDALNTQLAESKGETSRLQGELENTAQIASDREAEITRLKEELDLLRNGQNDEAQLAAQVSELKKELHERDKTIVQQNDDMNAMRAQNDQQAQELTTAKRQLDDLHAEAAEKDERLNRMQRENEASKRQIDELRQQLEAIQNAQATPNPETQTLRDKLKQLTTEHTELRERYDDLHEQLRGPRETQNDTALLETAKIQGLLEEEQESHATTRQEFDKLKQEHRQCGINWKLLAIAFGVGGATYRAVEFVLGDDDSSQ